MSETLETTPMIAIDQLSSSSPGSAEAGSLLIQVAKSPTYAAWLIIGGGGPRNALVIDNSAHGFKVVDGRAAHGSFLRISNPRFVVDGSPEAGTLFIGRDGPGILARLEHGECRVMLDGTISDDTSYTNFSGFRHWRIEVDGSGDEPVTLFSYRHRSLDKPA
jgi:hypothetical protein